jgi:hypothetical protein
LAKATDGPAAAGFRLIIQLYQQPETHPANSRRTSSGVRQRPAGAQKISANVQQVRICARQRQRRL